ncbi:2-(1,2-epoxy-1,2-dihydrophenyl)acetyl-CoA isomerase PaaG [Prosthecomicrobium sp. N25]|uniref:2-(1,2-epoxy-1,2-dihydrophenyl)acetyl-CoA isomerase PaaG n=1 Tax=Prosthecomicrobium sp. N25 TaxID=3129254 RepID=UPI003077F865
MSETASPAGAPPVLTEDGPGWRRIVLNRPDRLNSFNDALHAALREALEAAAADTSVRAVILTGAGRGFSAGQDLSDRVFDPAGPGPDLAATLDRNYNPLVRRLRAMPVPVIAAVNGVAAGAGANVALACDVVLAARSAKFIQAFSKIGLVPDSGGTWTLPRLVGRARAYALAALAEPVPAETAEAWGMIWRAVDDAALAAEAEALAARLAGMPTGALVTLREGLDHAETATLDLQLDWERDNQAALGRSADYREGVAAFLEKRAPKFTGRS